MPPHFVLLPSRRVVFPRQSPEITLSRVHFHLRQPLPHTNQYATQADSDERRRRRHDSLSRLKEQIQDQNKRISELQTAFEAAKARSKHENDSDMRYAAKMNAQAVVITGIIGSGVALFGICLNF